MVFRFRALGLVVAAFLLLAMVIGQSMQWRHVWNDFNKFLKELESADDSIDKRGIKPG